MTMSKWERTRKPKCEETSKWRQLATTRALTELMASVDPTVTDKRKSD